MEIQEYLSKIKDEKLTKVDLTGFQLSTIPEELFNYDWIETLYLGRFLHYHEYEFYGKSNCILETIPPSIVKLSTLKHLSLAGGLFGGSEPPITNFNILGKLTSLESLYLDSTLLENIEFIAHLPKLAHLQIAHTKIVDYSPLKNCSSLKSLYIGDNQINDIEFLENHEFLEALNVTSNQISDISSISNLKHLKRLCLCNNAIDDYSPVSKLKNLEHICSGSYHEFETIKHNTNLKELDFQLLTLDQLSQFKGFDNLNRIFIRKYEGDTLDLSNLKNASTIHVYGDFKSVVGMEDLMNLEDIHFSSYNLSTLKIPTLPILKSISIPETSLSTLDFYNSWENIEALDIGWTNISDIEVLKKSTKLNKLYFGKTKITDISPIIDCINESFRINFNESIMPKKFIQLFEEFENEGIHKYYKEYAG